MLSGCIHRDASLNLLGLWALAHFLRHQSRPSWGIGSGSMDVFENVLREEKNLAWVRAVLRVHLNGSTVVNSVPDGVEVD